MTEAAREGVITGIGIVSCLGEGLDTHWQKLSAGETALDDKNFVPYIVHPMHVAMILRTHGFDEDLVIAGLLHDTVEDCAIDPAAIEAQFGPGVGALVGAVTEQKTDADGERRPWRDRKLDQLAHLRTGDARIAALKCADALHNAALNTTATATTKTTTHRQSASPRPSVDGYILPRPLTGAVQASGG